MSDIRAVVFINDGTVDIAERIAVVSPHIELYQSSVGPVIAFVTREPMRDKRGKLWRALFAQNVASAENKQIMVAYEPSPARVGVLTYLTLLCPDKQSLEECLTDLVNNVIQKRLSERFGVVFEAPKYLLAIDTSPAQIERLIDTLHFDINSMLAAAYSEFQHWLHNVNTFEKLAKLLSKKGSGWLLIGILAVAMLFVLPSLLPQIMQMLHGFGLWKP